MFHAKQIKLRIVICFISLTWLPIAPTIAFAQTRFVKLSTAAAEVAKDIGVSDYMIKQSASDSGSAEANRQHSKMLYKIMLVSFQIRNTITAIDKEINDNTEMAEKLESKTQKNVDFANIANFLNAGTCEVIGSGVGLSSNALRFPSGIVSMYGGSMEIGLSALALKLQKGRRIDSPEKPNMLASIVDLQEGKSQYPASIWEYLTDPSPESKTGETRIQVMRKHWIDSGHMPSSSSSSDKHIIQLLAGTIVQRKALTAEMLSNRVLMLNELRVVVSSMDRTMSEVVSCLVNTSAED